MTFKSVLHFYKALLKGFFEGFSRFFKYQLLTTTLFSLLIMPIFIKASQMLVNNKGVKVVSNSTIFEFICSPQGVAFLMMSLTLVILGVLLELGGLIVISAQVIHRQKESDYSELFKSVIRHLPRMLEFGILLIVVYIIVLAPMTGMGLKLSFLEEVELPGFIFAFIESDDFYYSLYLLILFVMAILSVLWIFTFHFIIIGKMKPMKAVHSSVALVKRNWRKVIRDIMLVTVAYVLLFIIGEMAWSQFVNFWGDLLDVTFKSSRIFMVFLLLIQHMGNILIGMMFIPFEVFHFTQMFYEFVEHDDEFKALGETYPVVKAKKTFTLIDMLLKNRIVMIISVTSILIIIAIPGGVMFNEIFKPDYPIEIMGHRGGNEAPENTISAIKKSIESGADWVEIDVQRTKDGIYILNHDDTFERVAQIDEYVYDLFYKDIQKLDVGKLFNSSFTGERVPRLEDVLNSCNNKIKLNIELKGKTADRQMIDDIMKMIKSKKMNRQVILSSLDYTLVETIEKNYPNIDTGFIYFMSIGDISQLKADYLIVEEREVTKDMINRIHQAKKKVVVWNVNDQDDQWDYTRMKIDAIITDDVKTLRRILDERDAESDQDLIYNIFFQ